MNTELLPQFLRDMLSSPPERGGGLHQWLFRVARQLHKYRSPEDIVKLLCALTSDLPVKHNEIQEAVRNSKGWLDEPGQRPPGVSIQAWPSINRGLLDTVVFGMGDFDSLRQSSPVGLDPARSYTEDLIDILYPGNPLICVGDDNYSFKTEEREFFRGSLSKKPLIVPSAMSARQGKVKGSEKLSDHTLDNTGPRMFLVIEQDNIAGQKIPINQQAAVVAHLATKAPLIMVVHSGGKSLHAWFYCHGKEEEFLKGFMNLAVSLGADPALFTKSQFARMPDGTRQTGECQSVVFWDPEKLNSLRGLASHE